MSANRSKLAHFRHPLVALSLFCPVLGFSLASLQHHPPTTVWDFTALLKVLIVAALSAVGVVLALVAGLVGAMSQPGRAFKLGVFFNLASLLIAILLFIVSPLLKAQ